MRGRARRRAVWACAFLALVFTGYSARLIYLQVTRNEEYAALAAKNHTTRIPIPARRGLIMDRNGEILAANMPVRRVIVDGTHVKKPRALAAVAAPYLGIDEDTLAAQLETKSRYKVLLQELPEEKAFALMKEMAAKNLRGLYFYTNTSRTYPNGPMLSHVIGFLARKDPEDEHVSGVEGVERSLDRYLCGIDGFRHIERDRTGKEVVIYRGQEQAPRHGLNVQLTIDMGLQAILEAEMDAAFKEYRPETCTGILVDPKTGEILALANRPHFDLNNLNDTKPEQMINRAILDVVEPGSTFKIVVAAAALNERVVNERSLIHCENGSFAYGGRILRDHHGYGQMSVHDILVKSSNIGSAKMALMMGDDKYYEYVRRFGFGEKTGVELPGEIPGLLNPPSRWDKLTITRMPMGHAIAVTPLQIVMGMSVIANGGKLLRPHIVRSVKDENGEEIYRFEPDVVREVVPEKTAHFVSQALEGVVGEGGTARLAQVAGFTVAGKTGTAQKVDPKGGYTPGKYVVSFIGYMPAEDPRFVCLIMVNDAKIASNLNYGGLVAAPVFARVAEKAARYLDLPPSPKAEPLLPVAMRDIREETVRR
jgi:cell division protein FtsI (penicillin-binding protein 3)/stage V sporulation protein D (sporulation-specific penicillin-binding protein)